MTLPFALKSNPCLVLHEVIGRERSLFKVRAWDDKNFELGTTDLLINVDDICYLINCYVISS